VLITKKDCLIEGKGGLVSTGGERNENVREDKPEFEKEFLVFPNRRTAGGREPFPRRNRGKVSRTEASQGFGKVRCYCALSRNYQSSYSASLSTEVQGLGSGKCSLQEDEEKQE